MYEISLEKPAESSRWDVSLKAVVRNSDFILKRVRRFQRRESSGQNNALTVEDADGLGCDMLLLHKACLFVLLQKML